MDYAYDNNGNLIEDYNKSIENISYNYLNLPQRIWFGNGDSITYIYDAAGVKHAKLIDGSETGDRYYIGNMEYNQTQTLEYIHTNEGRVRYNGVDYAYDYYLKDHLGNTRVSFTESTTIPGQAEALQIDNYYPFGMRFNQAPILQVEENNYLYNGKELQENYRLDWYDYGWRFYDPAIARWHVIDPMVENQHHDYTPYAYVYNNPMRFMDPFGLDSIDAAALTQAAEDAVQHIIDTYDTDGTQSAQCNRGVSTAFEDLTGSDELNNKTANQQFDHMEGSDEFEEVEQSEVQDLSGDGTIVIAAKKENGHGHVAMGVPGQEEMSGSWDENVPQVMDTGENKRSSKQKISFSWNASAKDNITYFRYTGSTYTSRTYSGGSVPSATVSATANKYKTPIPVRISTNTNVKISR